MSIETILHKIEKSFSVSYLLLGGFLVFLIWAISFDIDETIRAQGSIVANGHTQIIQSADGGVLSKLLVSEGDSVEKNQLLATLEQGRVQASYQQIESQVAHLQASLTRAKAEASGEKLVFTKLSKLYPNFMSAQKALFRQKKRTLNEEVFMLKQALDISTEEWKLIKNLVTFGDVSQIEVLRAKQKILELQRKLSSVKNSYYEKIRLEIEQIEGDLSKGLHQLKEQQDILKYTEIRSPMSGIIKSLKVTTVGGVLRQGEELMSISPSLGGVVLETKINPVDVGRLKLGMTSSIKLDAFDYSIFGGLVGTVIHISSDTLNEKDETGKDMPFYQVNIKIDGVENPNSDKSKQIQIKLGMSGTVDMKVGKRSLFTYLTKPVTRGFSGALNEQ